MAWQAYVPATLQRINPTHAHLHTGSAPCSGRNDNHSLSNAQQAAAQPPRRLLPSLLEGCSTLRLLHQLPWLLVKLHAPASAPTPSVAVLTVAMEGAAGEYPFKNIEATSPDPTQSSSWVAAAAAAAAAAGPAS